MHTGGFAVNEGEYTLTHLAEDYINGLMSDEDYVRILINEKGFKPNIADVALRDAKRSIELRQKWAKEEEATKKVLAKGEER